MADRAQRGLVPNDVRQQHKTLDQAFSALFEHGLPVLVALVAGTPLASLAAVNLGEATTFWGVFLASLAWSLGVLVITAALQVEGVMMVHPMALLAGAAVVFVLSSAVATAFATGTLEQDPCPSGTCGSAADTIAAYLGEAIASFGFLGWLLSTVTGVFAGLWAVKVVKQYA